MNGEMNTLATSFSTHVRREHCRPSNFGTLKPEFKGWGLALSVFIFIFFTTDGLIHHLTHFKCK